MGRPAVVESIGVDYGVAPASVADLLVGVAGFLHAVSRRSDPPGLPTIRAFQRRQADAITAWMKSSRFVRLAAA